VLKSFAQDPMVVEDRPRGEPRRQQPTVGVLNVRRPEVLEAHEPEVFTETVGYLRVPAER
jgi:hypothetical protein